MKDGLKNEPIALESFEKCLTANTRSVELYTTIGLLINVKCPWFGYSADRLLKNDSNSFALLEVKCLKIRKTLSLQSFADSIPFLRGDFNGNLTLKRFAKYYSQIQFGTSILGSKNVVLILYHEKTNSTLNVDVAFDETYSNDLMVALTNVYFTRVLPFLYSRIVSTRTFTVL